MARRRKVDLVVVTCYNQQEVMERGLAVKKYLDCIMHSEVALTDRMTSWITLKERSNG